MRKVLFRILIIVFLFLVVVLGVAFYNDKTPLNVLKGRFGVENSVSIQESISTRSEKEKAIDVTETIKETVEKEGGSNSNANNTLSDEDKEAAKKLIDGLITK